jgi:hypothetical protein
VAEPALRKALRSRSNLVVAAALDAIAAHELPGYAAAIVEAFARAQVKPSRSDPGCRSKLAAVRALDAVGEVDEELLLAAVRTTQPEPVWGGSRDTAVELRGVAAMALVNRRHPATMVELARLLADPEPDARRMAADAIAATGDVATGVPLLTLRICAEDPAPEVTTACFAALLSLDPEQTLEFVLGYLRGRDAGLVEAAALALGQERPVGALAALSELADASLGNVQRVAMLAIAMLRSDAGWDTLLDQVAHAGPSAAHYALEALAIYREHPQLSERVRAAVAGRDGDDDRLADDLRRWFDT